MHQLRLTISTRGCPTNTSQKPAKGGVLIEKKKGIPKIDDRDEFKIWNSQQQKSVFLKHQILKFQILIVMDRKFKKDPFWIRFGNIVCLLCCANQGFCSTFIIEK